MPWSCTNNGLPALLDWINANNISTVLDIGAGAGKYGLEIREHCPNVTTIDAIEIFPEYRQMFDLDRIYDSVTIADARHITSFPYDLVVLGDVIEHMQRSDAIAMWSNIAASARYAYIAMPIGICEQEGYFIDPDTNRLIHNEYEAHVEPVSSEEEILQSFDGIFSHCMYSLIGIIDNPTFETGCFYAKFPVEG